MEGHRQVLLLDGTDEALEPTHLLLRGAIALPGLVKARDGEDRELRALRLRQREGVEGPGLVDLLRDPEVLEAHLGHQRLPLADGAGLPGLGVDLLLLDDVLALHHAEDADVLVAHVLGGGDVGGGLQVGDDGQLLYDLLQQLHLVGAVDVGVWVVVDAFDLLAELEDLRGDIPHGPEHALKWSHGELGDDAREGQAAEDHDEDDEDDGQQGHPGLQNDGAVHVEGHHETICVHPQRRGCSSRPDALRRPGADLGSRRLIVAIEGAEAIGVCSRHPDAGGERAEVGAGEEGVHEPQLNHCVVYPAVLQVRRYAVDPCLQGVVTLREGPDVEQRDDHH
mmetsp:Transcript_34038/g.86107  ORF Transcript_34038/g.86107 Transcript_34038/m.86107 type:complete len:337 (+) Transcript_34038:1090-2100(+)